MPENQSEAPVAVYPTQEQDSIEMQGKLNEHTTMLGGVVRAGRVVKPNEQDPPMPNDIPRVLVHIGAERQGSFVRNWMPWTTTRSGFDGEWWAPEEGEQVLVLAPAGNLALGYIIGSIYRQSLTFDLDANGIKPRDPYPGEAKGAQESDKHIHTRIYKDGTCFSYDRFNHQLKLEFKTSPDVDAHVKFNCTADESIEVIVGKTKIMLKKNGALDIEAEDQEITLKGNVKIIGTLDVV